MTCPKCKDFQVGVLRTLRGVSFDLREHHCRNKKCRHVFYSKTIKLSLNDFEFSKKLLIAELDKGLMTEDDQQHQ